VGFHEFSVAGTFGTTVSNGTAVDLHARTVPGDYTTNGNITISFNIADPVATSGTVTFCVLYTAVTPPGAVQPTLFTSTPYCTSATTLSGTINTWVTASAVITPNTSGSPQVHAGDLLYLTIYLSAKSATQTPYITATMSY
jgi:hypothetical protein